MLWVVCGEVLCDGRYVVKFYVMGGMWREFHVMGGMW